MERLYQLLVKFHQSSGFKIQWSPSSQPKLFQLRVPFHFGCQLNAFGASIINKQGVMVPKPKVQNLKSYLRGGICPRFHTRGGGGYWGWMGETVVRLAIVSFKLFPMSPILHDDVRTNFSKHQIITLPRGATQLHIIGAQC